MSNAFSLSPSPLLLQKSLRTVSSTRGTASAPAALGMAANKLLESLGKADFQKDNDDGTTL